MVEKNEKKISASFEENITYMNQILPVKESFDIIRREIEIGGRSSVFYYIDGFVKDEAMLKIMDSILSVEEKDMPEDAEAIGWWLRNEDGTYPKNQWRLIDHHWYLFNPDGYLCTGWHRWDGTACDPENGGGDWYFLDNTAGSPYEGACWHTRENGAQEIWHVE